ncbi:uncharacterized protein Nmag_2119 [Natrialba magadii ATCC 43099]|uniref:Uncharacterized protein n=1 Tax=Natrialba magadii (strain ATCC 43099 / DSM 3394 / CCM 3739 / CIP 104546 / IAM 13178 / JCM 8861 / NBRC 102185 / NCIMB 2190 / MS3) TaxID=547559 RepID=D3SW27_NATMM|nr:hypothetical protein [Natrialba magadii]ADD05688.1 uncharacterized protein Nmag_2119 [Natrialba magadii ATCC 43099]ELY29900.1 hypothetical protein C500_09829 [Natrialba magadii ATCC 43099]
MVLHRWAYRTSADALHPGTTVRYYYRTGDSLATVTERTERYVTFIGEECNGRFTHDQIDRLIRDGRLEVVLDDTDHLPPAGEGMFDLASKSTQDTA